MLLWCLGPACEKASIYVIRLFFISYKQLNDSSNQRRALWSNQSQSYFKMVQYSVFLTTPPNSHTPDWLNNLTYVFSLARTKWCASTAWIPVKGLARAKANKGGVYISFSGGAFLRVAHRADGGRSDLVVWRWPIWIYEAAARKKMEQRNRTQIHPKVLLSKALRLQLLLLMKEMREQLLLT